MGSTLDGHRVERAAAGEQCPPGGPEVGFLCGAFGLRGRVGQREDDRPLVQPRHFLEYLARERLADRGDAYDCGGLDRLQRGQEVRRIRVLVRVGPLVLAQVCARLDHQSPRIDQPAALTRFGFAQPLADHRRNDEVADAGRRLARAEEQQALRFELRAGHAQRRVKPCQRDARRSLNVVVEAAHAVAILVQQAKSVEVREVLELDDRAWKDFVGRRHELLDERVILGAAQSRPLEPDIEGILQESGVVGADVEHHRKRGGRMNSRARGVQRELADRDAHAVGTQIAEPQDAFAVGDHDDLHVARAPIAQQGRDPAAILRRNPYPPRTLEDVREALARKPDRGGIDERHDLVRVFDDHPEEQGLVSVVQRVEIDELVEIGRLTAQTIEHPCHLLLWRDDGGRQQASQAQRIALGIGECGALVEQGVAQQIEPPGKVRAVRADMWTTAHWSLCLLVPRMLPPGTVRHLTQIKREGARRLRRQRPQGFVTAAITAPGC